MDTKFLDQTLWPDGNSPSSPQVYALLDGARDSNIARQVLGSGLPYSCLFSGDLSPALQEASPYIVQIAPEGRFFKTLAQAGWGRAWGIYAVAQPHVTLHVLRKHFRALLQVSDEDGKILMFRFYDPRVLRLYLPTCTPAERRQVFGPVDRIVLEAGDSLDAELVQELPSIQHVFGKG